MGETYVMRRMRRSELDEVVEWAAAEGWNPGVHDAEAFFAADPEGFFVGTLDGRVIASISVVTYDRSYAFVGFYLVRPEHRGSGYGRRLWRHALAQTRATTIGLDGVVAQVPTYARAGFRLAYRSVRFVVRSSETRPRGGIRPIVDADVPRLTAYDQHVFGAPRARFLLAWLDREGVHGRLMERTGSIVGYGAIRPATDGYRIGPLFAESAAVADDLLSELLGSVPPGVDAAVDVPQANPHVAALTRIRRASAVFETARMYAGPEPAQRVEQIFGVTSFELG